MKHLRDHQTVAIEMLRDSLRRGKRKPVLQLSVASGKTRIAAEIIKNAMAKGKRCVFAADAITLIDQTVNAFWDEGIHNIGVLQADHPMTDPARQCQVASVQTLTRRQCPPFDIFIQDECFPSGTMVSTPEGNKPIDNILRGDIVHNAIGVGRVKHVMRKMVDELAHITLASGQTVTSTADHPWFTGGGWVQARSLAGKSICGRKELLHLWGASEAQVPAAPNGKMATGKRGPVDEAEFLRVILRSEILESDVTSRKPRKDGSDAADDWAQANLAGWKWEASNRPSENDARRFGGRVEGRACCEDICSTDGDHDLSSVLQGGFGQSRADDSDGDRWGQSQWQEENDRCQERRFPDWQGVESVEIEKLSSPRLVFNLHVEGHPSYFAEGFLVHNCHASFAVIRELMEDNPTAIFIGLSATPWAKGMGLIWDDLIKPISMKGLIDLGYVMPVTAYAPWSPDLSKVKIKAGEYDEGAVEIIMKGEKVVANAIDSWRELGEGRPTFSFEVNCATAKDTQERFCKAGIPWGYIDAKTEASDRRKQFRQMDTGEIKGISSVAALIKGVDEKVACILWRAPTKSPIKLVQGIGRALRDNPPWTDAIVIDQTGSLLQLGMPVDIDRAALCTKAKGEKSDVEAQAAILPKPCPACGKLKTARICVCGFETKRESDVSEGAGQLRRTGGGGKAGPKKAEPTLFEKTEWYAMMRHVQLARNKSDGWLAHQHHAKWGEWPNGMKNVLPMKPSPEVLSWEKSRRIRYAKGMAKRQGRAA